MTIELVLLGALTVTAYQPIPQQTRPECQDRHHCETPDGNNFSELGIAVSRDLLASGRVHYGDALYVEGHGWHIISDTMGPRASASVDLPVYSLQEEKAVKVKRLKVYKAEVRK